MLHPVDESRVESNRVGVGVAAGTGLLVGVDPPCSMREICDHGTVTISPVPSWIVACAPVATSMSVPRIIPPLRV